MPLILKIANCKTSNVRSAAVYPKNNRKIDNESSVNKLLRYLSLQFSTSVLKSVMWMNFMVLTTNSF